MGRHIVCLTFDVDVMTGFIARGMTTPTPISRGEFGLVALPRILDLLRAHLRRAGAEAAVGGDELVGDGDGRLGCLGGGGGVGHVLHLGVGPRLRARGGRVADG